MFDRPLKLDSTALLEHLFEGAYIVDSQRRILTWNAAARAITGFEAAEVIGRGCSNSLLVHVDEHGRCLCDSTGCPFSKVAEGSAVRGANVYLRHREGYRVPVRVRTVDLDGEGELKGAMLQLFREDLSAEVLRSELEQMREVALVDVLTGLPNRRAMEQVLLSRLSEYKRHGQSFGVLFIDIDNFKALNDAHGHDVGDDALRMVSRTIAHSLRRHDTVARWGGEEFVAVLSHLDLGAMPSVAQKLRALVAQSELRTAVGPVAVTVSVGGTQARPDDDLDTLLRRADQLMYSSKRQGKNRITLDSMPAFAP